MFTRKALIITVVLVLGITFCAFADDKALNEKKSKEGDGLVTMAVFKTPEIDKDKAVEISKSLSDEKGVISARPDLKKGKFSVVFDQKIIDSKKVLNIVQDVVQNAELDDEKKVKGDRFKRDCGKCPHRKTCAEAGKK